jgi:FkbM family methyltransferase
MVTVEWGLKKTPLNFDRHPYPIEEAPLWLQKQLCGYEPEIINVIEHFVEPGDCAIDAGASIGFHTCLLSKLVGETGLVFAFEPHAISFKYLVHHVHVANRCNNVALYPFALWKIDMPKLELWSIPELGYSSFHKYADFTSSEMVEGRALDSLLINPADHPRFIKIDCEGTEAEVLLGAENILKKGVDCVVLELNYYLFEKTNRSDLVLRSYMKDLGYDMFLINIARKDGQQGFGFPMKVAHDVPIILQGGHHINVMFSTEEKVRDRWKT